MTSYTIRWNTRDGTRHSVTVTDPDNTGAGAVRSMARMEAKRSGWTPRRWWQWWRWDEHVDIERLAAYRYAVMLQCSQFVISMLVGIIVALLLQK